MAWRLESWACNLKVAGSILAPAGIEGGDCARHRTPNCSPGAGAMAAHCSVCVFTVCVCSLLTAVLGNLDGLNAEHQFRVWVTILDNASHYYYYYYYMHAQFYGSFNRLFGNFMT